MTLFSTIDIKFAFQIISSEKSFTVFADSIEEKRNWLKNVEMVLKGEAAAGIQQLCMNYSLTFIFSLASSFIYNSRVIALQPAADPQPTNSSPLAIDQSNIDSEEAPVWVPDSQAKMCMICGTHFTVVKRRVSSLLKEPKY